MQNSGSKLLSFLLLESNFVAKYNIIFSVHHFLSQQLNVRSVDLVSREWCELVFEGRNRSYGAYRLRQEAGRRYQRALLGTTLGLFLIIGVVWGVNTYVSHQSDRELACLLEEMRRMETSHRQDDHLLRFIDTRPKEEIPLQKPLASVPEIVDEPVAEVVPTPKVEKVLPSQSVVDTLVAMSDTLAKVEEPEEEILPPPLTATEVVQDMPEFPGGIAALMRWLDKNIIYPPLVVQQNIKGVTYLTFLVNHEGVVTEPQVEAPLHPMISAAIMTAARKMPKWEPAKSSGIPAVRITIPIEYHSNK